MSDHLQLDCLIGRLTSPLQIASYVSELERKVSDLEAKVSELEMRQHRPMIQTFEPMPQFYATTYEKRKSNVPQG